MKAFLKIAAAAALAGASSGCSSFLDINTNPNSFTTSSAPTPDAILAQALATTASNYSINYNSYANFAATYWGKSGIVNGYAEERTYNYSSSYYQSLWNNTYDNLNDYNIIQQQAGTGYAYHAAIARIMKAYNYLLLVDEYGDIPYTNALKGLDNLTPSYDSAPTIYKDLIVQLTGAIADINTAAAQPTVTAPRAVGPEDVVFAGNMTNWKQFANSLKLRILLRESQTTDAALNTYVAQQMTALQTAADGFITADVVVNPGYVQSSGQQNPFFNRYGNTSAGATAPATERYYQIPTNYVIQQYTNNLSQRFVTGVSDPRIQTLYTLGHKEDPANPGTAITQYVGTDPGEPAPPLISTTNLTYASRFTSPGILKGLNAPTPLMLASEQFFNKAEAETRLLFSGGETAAKQDFINGMVGSFMYFYRPATTAVSAVPTTATALAASTLPGISQYNTYALSASTNANVNYDLAIPNGTLGKQSVILFQKYLAMNTVAATEAWDDYRRAAQPKLIPSKEAALKKFPTRLFYPLTEVNTNTANVPQGVTQYTKIFWDVVD